MAKVLFGAGTTDMRNKLNGWVYSRNRYGAYVRTKTTPVNPQTSYQQAVRQRLGNLSSQWRGLTESQRKAWRDATPDFQVIDIFGYPQKLAGNTLYVRLNQNLLNIGESSINVPPVPESIPDFFLDSMEAVASPAAITLTTSEATVPTGFSLAIYATGNIGPGVSYVKNRLKFIGTAEATASEADITDLWTDRFGEPIAGQKIIVRARLISTTTGQAGLASQTEALIS